MPINNSNNVFMSMGVRNKGIGGLASGLDTDSLMEAMTTGTRSKIAQQQIQRQTLNWRMSAYRSTATAITNFRNRFFSFSNTASQNLLSTGFYNSFRASSSNANAVSVSPGSNAAVTDFSIRSVHQLATAQSLTQKNSLSAPLTGGQADMTADFTGQTISLNVDGSVKVIRLDSLNDIAANADAPGFNMDGALQTALQGLVNDAFGVKQTAGGAPIVTVDVSGGKVTFGAQTNRVAIAAMSRDEVLGFKSTGPDSHIGLSNRVDTSTKLRDIQGLGGDRLAGDMFRFTINGVQIDIGANETIASLMSRVNASTANVRMNYSAVTDTFTIASRTTGAGSNLDIQDNFGNLMNTFFGSRGSSQIAVKNLADSAGVTSGDRLSAMTDQEMLAFVKGYDLRSYNVTIGDETRSIMLNFSKDSIIADKMRAGGAPNAEDIVRVLNQGIVNSFSASDRQGFVFELNDDGIITGKADTGVEFRLSDSIGAGRDFFRDLGFDAENRTNAVNLNTADLKTLNLVDLGFAEGIYAVSVNGENRSLVIDHTTKVSELEAMLTDDGLGISLRTQLITPVPVRPANFESLSEGEKDRIIALEEQHRRENTRLVLNAGGNTIADAGDNGLLSQLFGAGAFAAGGESYGDRMTAGKNSEITIVDGNGGETLISNSSNTFSLNGVNLTLNTTFNNEAGNINPSESIQITVRSEPDDLIGRIKGFIEEYNTMIEGINTLIFEEKVSGYTALSDEQKAQMTGAEIEKWEIEARKGILSNDRTLRGIVDQMRGVLFERIESAGLSAMQIGISPISAMGNPLDTGKMQINEDTLRRVIEQNPEVVRLVFTDPANGVAAKLNQIMDKAVNTSSLPESRGSLVRMAGTTSLTADNTSNLGRQIDEIDRRMATLRTRLESEYSRHWKLFTSLERALGTMNTQSDWLFNFSQ